MDDPILLQPAAHANGTGVAQDGIMGVKVPCMITTFERVPLAVVLIGGLALAAGPGAAAAQTCPEPASLTAGLTLPMAAVRYLADDALDGRLAGSAGEQCAGDYIAREFARMGLRPGGEHDTFFQAVPLASAINPHAPAGTGRNVIAILDGADDALKHE